MPEDLSVENIELKASVEELWDNWHNNKSEHDFSYNNLSSLQRVIEMLDSGKIRVAESVDGRWEVHEWLKKAVMMFLYLQDSRMIHHTPDYAGSGWWFDKVDPKFQSWSKEDFLKSGIRSVPGSFVRKSAYIGSNCVLMPCFVNVGAHIGNNTMIDTWSTVGSCAQIGDNCHISGGVGIAGVLEPIGHQPVIVEDGCFIGARSEIAEGVIIRKNSVISMGVYLSSSTKIVDRETGEIRKCEVPEGSVVIPGSLQDKNSKIPVSVYCAVIAKRVDQSTKRKVKINELLRKI